MVQDVAVFGSLNVDVAFTCRALPSPGETIICDRSDLGPGGKGLNQAVAAALAGAETIIYGALGCDSNGQYLTEFLQSKGVSTAGVVSLEDYPTGLAHIVVNGAGENSIVVSSGANRAASLTPHLFASASARVFLAQCETDPDLIAAFFDHGVCQGSLRILNAAPALDSARSLIGKCDILVVNEHELAFFAGEERLGNEEASIIAAAKALLGGSTHSVIVTLGSAGVIWASDDMCLSLPARRVNATDTTGAGDCFCGVLAASLAQGASMQRAIQRSIDAAALAVTRSGAAAAIPAALEYDV